MLHALTQLPFVSEIRPCVLLCIGIATLVCASPNAAAAVSASIVHVKGSGTTTVTNLVYNADGTISIEADQAGQLTRFGQFTGHFSYLAVPTPAAILLAGTGSLRASNGDQLFLKVSLIEIGLDYPRALSGTLTITGGTGRYAGATGSLIVSGKDEESLTDTLTIDGSIITVTLASANTHAKKG